MKITKKEGVEAEADLENEENRKKAKSINRTKRKKVDQEDQKVMIQTQNITNVVIGIGDKDIYS